jgi:heme-degrading monooxygenase HmoA
MIAVIFEVWVDDRGKVDYLEMAAALRPLVEHVDGFISIERFASMSEPTKLLSLSFFRDEPALEAWRNIDAHRRAQVRGRSGVFANYRLRIAGVVRDYGMNEREQAPPDSRALHR